MDALTLSKYKEAIQKQMKFFAQKGEHVWHLQFV